MQDQQISCCDFEKYCRSNKVMATLKGKTKEEKQEGTTGRASGADTGRRKRTASGVATTKTKKQTQKTTENVRTQSEKRSSSVPLQVHQKRGGSWSKPRSMHHKAGASWQASHHLQVQPMMDTLCITVSIAPHAQHDQGPTLWTVDGVCTVDQCRVKLASGARATSRHLTGEPDSHLPNHHAFFALATTTTCPGCGPFETTCCLLALKDCQAGCQGGQERKKTGRSDANDETPRCLPACDHFLDATGRAWCSNATTQKTRVQETLEQGEEPFPREQGGGGGRLFRFLLVVLLLLLAWSPVGPAAFARSVMDVQCAMRVVHVVRCCVIAVPVASSACPVCLSLFHAPFHRGHLFPARCFLHLFRATQHGQTEGLSNSSPPPGSRLVASSVTFSSSACLRQSDTEGLGNLTPLSTPFVRRGVSLVSFHTFSDAPKGTWVAKLRVKGAWVAELRRKGFCARGVGVSFALLGTQRRALVSGHVGQQRCPRPLKQHLVHVDAHTGRRGRPLPVLASPVTREEFGKFDHFEQFKACSMRELLCARVAALGVVRPPTSSLAGRACHSQRKSQLLLFANRSVLVMVHIEPPGVREEQRSQLSWSDSVVCLTMHTRSTCLLELRCLETKCTGFCSHSCFDGDFRSPPVNDAAALLKKLRRCSTSNAWSKVETSFDTLTFSEALGSQRKPRKAREACRVTCFEDEKTARTTGVKRSAKGAPLRKWEWRGPQRTICEGRRPALPNDVSLRSVHPNHVHGAFTDPKQLSLAQVRSARTWHAFVSLAPPGWFLLAFARPAHFEVELRSTFQGTNTEENFFEPGVHVALAFVVHVVGREHQARTCTGQCAGLQFVVWFVHPTASTLGTLSIAWAGALKDVSRKLEFAPALSMCDFPSMEVTRRKLQMQTRVFDGHLALMEPTNRSDPLHVLEQFAMRAAGKKSPLAQKVGGWATKVSVFPRRSKGAVKGCHVRVWFPRSARERNMPLSKHRQFNSQLFESEQAAHDGVRAFVLSLETTLHNHGGRPKKRSVTVDDDCSSGNAHDSNKKTRVEVRNSSRRLQRSLDVHRRKQFADAVVKVLKDTIKDSTHNELLLVNDSEVCRGNNVPWSDVSSKQASKVTLQAQAMVAHHTVLCNELDARFKSNCKKRMDAELNMAKKAGSMCIPLVEARTLNEWRQQFCLHGGHFLLDGRGKWQREWILSEESLAQELLIHAMWPLDLQSFALQLQNHVSTSTRASQRQRFPKV
eukprot:jgi/Bigna1/78930/fgenesh1_pg.58_\